MCQNFLLCFVVSKFQVSLCTEILSFGLFLLSAVQQSCWNTFKCNSAVGKVAHEALSIRPDSLHFCGSRHLNFDLSSFALISTASCHSFNRAKSVVPATSRPRQGRWLCWPKRTFAMLEICLH